jgi:hypothetical protein
LPEKEKEKEKALVGDYNDKKNENGKENDITIIIKNVSPNNNEKHSPSPPKEEIHASKTKKPKKHLLRQQTTNLM